MRSYYYFHEIYYFGGSSKPHKWKSQWTAA